MRYSLLASKEAKVQRSREITRSQLRHKLASYHGTPEDSPRIEGIIRDMEGEVSSTHNPVEFEARGYTLRVAPSCEFV
jgi:hypothetical protein